MEAGDSRRSFTIQSVMKPLSLLLALQDNGRETVRAHVGVEATGKPFDAILLDAPCTASGVVRRQPDTPWLRRPDDIKKLASEQKRLLKTLWPLLRKGGRMLYATCSIFPEEGTGQMKAFLAATPDARLVPLFAGNDGMLTLLPEESGEWRSDAQLPTVHDGFFYALLEKQA